MTIVSGPIKLVTEKPSAVTQVLLRARELRLHGNGVVVDSNDPIPVVGGVIEFSALPGPAVMTMVSNGLALNQVDMIIPDQDVASLSECLDQIYVYDPPVVGRAQAYADEAGAAADRAVAGADRVGSAEQVGKWVDEAETLRDDTVEAADRAQTQAGVATEQAGVAAGHAEQAGADHAQTGADRRQTGEDRVQTGEDREAAEGWASQSKDAATLAITAAATVSQYVGDGFPEGKVAAPVGSIYVDRQATAGAVRWIKTSGTGNTGWRVEWGDTGWRLIPNRYPEPEQTGQIFIRRIGNRCSLRVVDFTMPGNYARHMATIPQGFRSVEKFYDLLVDSSAKSINSVVGSYVFNSLSWTRDINGGYGRPEHPQSGELDYLTDDAWPSTLPGTPA